MDPSDGSASNRANASAAFARFFSIFAKESSDADDEFLAASMGRCIFGPLSMDRTILLRARMPAEADFGRHLGLPGKEQP